MIYIIYTYIYIYPKIPPRSTPPAPGWPSRDTPAKPSPEASESRKARRQQRHDAKAQQERGQSCGAELGSWGSFPAFWDILSRVCLDV